MDTWESGEFFAAAFIDNGMVRLSVSRQNGKDGITWDELKKIKTDCGFGNYDAVEFYPRDDDVINTGNLRHLYISNVPLPVIKRREMELANVN